MHLPQKAGTDGRRGLINILSKASPGRGPERDSRHGHQSGPGV